MRDNIEMDIKYIAFKYVDWVDLAQNRGKGVSFFECGDEFCFHTMRGIP